MGISQKSIERLKAFRALLEDWDSYGGLEISDKAISEATRLLNALPNPNGVIPLSNGGVQLEWSGGGVNVEIEIGPDGQADIDAFDMSKESHGT